MNIREIIRANGLTIQEFADSLYVSRRTVHNWLSGKIVVPRSKKMQIADTYKKKTKGKGTE